MIKNVRYFVMLSLLLLAACGEGSGSPGSEPISALAPVPVEYVGKANPFEPGAAEEGEKIFGTDCETCHGPQGYGDGPAGDSLDPKPKNLAELQKIATDDYLLWRISAGKAGTSMVAWKGILTEEQIWQVISFIRTLQ